MYARYEPLGPRLFVHDCLSVMLIGYWIYLVLFIHRIRSPLLPFLIFFVHVALEPSLLVGESAVFLRFKRFVAFQIGYPIALLTLSLWLLAWGTHHRERFLNRIQSRWETITSQRHSNPGRPPGRTKSGGS